MSTDPGVRPERGEDTPLAGDPNDRIIQGHKYDGIREYDNPMPGWWVYLFWGTIGFSLFYVLGLHAFNFIDSYQEDLAESTEMLESVRASYAEANPTFTVDEATLAQFVGDPAAAKNGSDPYTTYCAACHGAQGQGLIGPNLTDEYWVHGGSNVDIYNVLTNGVVEKGMPAWDNAITPEGRAELIAYIRSLEGTDPPGAKAPEGELYQAATGDSTATG